MENNILEIKKYPADVLRRKTIPLDKIEKKDIELIEKMINTMHLAGGVGLAANQVGISKQIIVINATGEDNNDIVIINPKIVSRKGSAKDTEGCLSLPEVNADVKRAKQVVAKGIDTNGKDITIEAEGLLARILQHEIDHLNGILFTDRIAFFTRNRLLKKYMKKK